MIAAIALLLPVTGSLAFADAATPDAGIDAATNPIDALPADEPMIDLPDIPEDEADSIAEDVVEEISEQLGAGEASYYGNELAGNRTASGEIFDPAKLTAAHRTLPLGSRVRVTHRRNGKSVIVRINDRGPFHGNRIIDLSTAAAREIGMVRTGRAQVDLELLAD